MAVAKATFLDMRLIVQMQQRLRHLRHHVLKVRVAGFLLGLSPNNFEGERDDYGSPSTVVGSLLPAPTFSPPVDGILGCNVLQFSLLVGGVAATFLGERRC
jgi:hypothetical protein